MIAQKHIVYSIFIILIFIGPGCKKSQKKQCLCMDSNYSEIPIGTYEEIPKDLTSVTFDRNTTHGIVKESLELLNQVNSEPFSDKDSLELFVHLEEQVDQWLGGPNIGDCGNLFEGTTIETNSFSPQKIRVKPQDMKLTLLQSRGANKAFVYQSDITFGLELSNSQNVNIKGNSKAIAMVVLTCGMK